ncbi:MAG: patatin-like phospholipase family protein [Flavobacteriales bacterium]
MKKITVCLLVMLATRTVASDSLLVKNLVFEGAGIRGIAYCGALMELDEHHMLDSVTHVAGTSSGAITACLYSVGYTPQEIFDIIGDTDFGAFNDGRFGAAGGMVRVKKKLGWYKGEKFLTWLEKLIAAKTGSTETTFSQLRDKAQSDSHFKELVVAATSLNHQCSVYFSTATYPHMRLADAVHASMAVPLYFEPVVIDSIGTVIPLDEMTTQHHLCVDGGFTANYIINYFDMDTSAQTLGMRIDSDDQIANDRGSRELAYQHINSPGDFVQAFYYITKENLNRSMLTEADWHRTVSISDTQLGPKVKRLSDTEKQQLVKAGRDGVKQYLAER